MRLNGETHQFKTDMVMQYVADRIRALASKVNDHGLSAQFKNVTAIHMTAGSDGGFSVMGSILFDGFLFGPVLDAADAGLGGTMDVSANFNGLAVVAMDAYGMMTDDGDTVRSIRYNGSRVYYPKGRNKAKMKIDTNMVSNFNRASNQNYASGYGMEAELAALIDILQKMETLVENHKVRDITVQKGESIAQSINKLHKSAQKNGGLDLMSGGLRRMI